MPKRRPPTMVAETTEKRIVLVGGEVVGKDVVEGMWWRVVGGRATGLLLMVDGQG